ncbi:MAG: guanine deaminase [Betaproteobacteria bacterium]
MTGTHAFRASILHFLANPDQLGEEAHQYFADGLLIVKDGRVHQIGDASTLLAQLPEGTPVMDYRGHLILPGFVDTHVHFAQTDIIASHGEQVLEWLERYTFPEEQRFSDERHAADVAQFTVREMLRNGTTTSMVFATVHKSSVDAIMTAAESEGLCMIAGKVMMDRNCPDSLSDTADSSYRDSKELIARWHGAGLGRLHYAVTPRFAPTSTERQLELAGKLLDEHPGVYLQSHLAENKSECEWVQQLFPWSKSYLDVYERFGLLRPQAVYAHCIHLSDADRRRMAEKGVAMAFCPTSNLFLGSGLFDAAKTSASGVRMGMGTDVGGGTSFSLLRTLHEAYKVIHLTGQSMNAFQGLYRATLGGAHALYLDDEIGNFAPGKYADFVVLDLAATPLIERRLAKASTLAEQLFVLMMMGDEHMVAATHVQGRKVYARARKNGCGPAIESASHAANS